MNNKALKEGNIVSGYSVFVGNDHFLYFEYASDPYYVSFRGKPLLSFQLWLY